MLTFLELPGNFPSRGLPPLYSQKSALFLEQCGWQTLLGQSRLLENRNREQVKFIIKQLNKIYFNVGKSQVRHRRCIHCLKNSCIISTLILNYNSVTRGLLLDLTRTTSNLRRCHHSRANSGIRDGGSLFLNQAVEYSVTEAEMIRSFSLTHVLLGTYTVDVRVVRFQGY